MTAVGVTGLQEENAGTLRQLVLTASPRLCKSIRSVIRKTRATLVAAARQEGGDAGLQDMLNKVTLSFMLFYICVSIFVACKAYLHLILSPL